MLVEIRAAEGGDDAKNLVREQFALYQRRAKFLNLKLELIEELPSQISFRVSGPKGWAEDAFSDERGGHRWQRIPPNEKRGRVHTSTVTVACMPENAAVSYFEICDVDFRYDRGTGPGGQNKNKVETRVTATHVPSGAKVVCDVERTQGQNKRLALALLQARVVTEARRKAQQADALTRKEQVGSGMRGDKRRTIRMQDGIVKDHLSGQTWEINSYLSGKW